MKKTVLAPRGYRLRLHLKPLVTLLLAMATFSQAMSQQRIVEGTVRSQEDGTALPGVNVIIQGTSKGSVTDFNGHYALEVADDEAVLVFSYVGYQTVEQPVGALSVLDLELPEDHTALQEIVVVGYGTQKKENLSGAVDAIDSKTLEDRPIQTIAQGLQGAVPNLNIDFLSGEPGATPRINVRGFTSINGGEPLILVDGVPTEASALNYLAPNDVAGISVLKDASSAAIYGARAAYGVVLITTKSGSKDGVRINYNNNFSWGTPTVIPDKITDPYIYLRLRETSTDNTPWDNQNYSDETYAWAKARSEDPSAPAVRTNPNDAAFWEYMGDQDWTQYFLDDYTFSQNHNISVGGQKDDLNFFLSGAYDTQSGALKIADDYFDRYTMRGKLNFQAADWLSLGNNTTYSFSERKKPTHLSMWELYNFHPTDYPTNPDGTWGNNALGRTGALLTNGGNISNRVNFLQSTFSAQANIVGDIFKVNADYTIRTINTDSASYQTKYKIGYGPDYIREEGTNAASRMAGFNNYSVFNLYGTYDQAFGRHRVGAIAGFNQEYSRSEYFIAQRDRVISASLPSIGLATGESIVDEYIADWSVRGAFYRLNYMFDEKYILELNGRYDGSSKFPTTQRFGFFPSVSAAWRIDQEPFWQNMENTINFFKLRASYGSLGNQFVSEYGYIATMDSYRGNYLIGGSLPQIVTAPPLVSSNYTWERVSSQNAGIDLGFFEQRLALNFDYYVRETEGMLTLGKDLPDVLGALEPNENAADLKTRGWELSIAYNDEMQLAGRPLSLSSRFILSDSRSFITSFDNPSNSILQYYEGQEIGELWGLQSDGLFANEQEIEALDQTDIIPWGALTIVPGWPKYQDLDGNDRIEKGYTTDDPKDLSVIGNIMPRMRFAFNLGVNYMGFDVSAFFQGVGKMDYYPLHHLYWGFYQQPYAGGYTHLQDFYRGTSETGPDRERHTQSYIDAGLADANTDAYYPVLQAWLADRNLGERIDESQGLAIPQTRYLLDGSYLRLKNLTIGYTLPASLLERLHLGTLRIYVSGENLTTWSEVKPYFDPEAITDNTAKTNPTASTSNGWGYAYPFQRRYSFGLNLQF
jgi:TonB-linked SusC/RagA family outer membrane protein